MCVCPSFLVPSVTDSLSQLVCIHICFLLQSSLAMVISLDLLLLYSCRLQIVECIHIGNTEVPINNTEALKHLLMEINYNWHLWEKNQVIFLYLFAFWKVSCRILVLILPVNTCMSCSLPWDSKGLSSSYFFFKFCLFHL